MLIALYDVQREEQHPHALLFDVTKEGNKLRIPRRLIQHPHSGMLRAVLFEGSEKKQLGYVNLPYEGVGDFNNMLEVEIKEIQ